mgnify:CR=1 FL=1
MKLTIEQIVIAFLNKKMLEDKKQYKGINWSDESWITTEIMQFLAKDFSTSYILIEFGNKYDYYSLEHILKTNFRHHYDRATNS